MTCHISRVTDRTLCVYLLPGIVSRLLYLVKMFCYSRLQKLNAFQKCVAMIMLVMVSCYPWY